MRITGGAYRGRTIYSDSGTAIRPATDRVRETIFSILQNYLDYDETAVVDLYAGTGSLGFECLSRGAPSVIFVDASRDAVRLIRRTADSLQCSNRCRIVQSPAVRFLRTNAETASLIFADPPYATEGIAELPAVIAGSAVTESGTMLLIEHTKRLQFPESDRYECFRRKIFGETVVSFFRIKRSQMR
jgi:16S rRNA (guanine966-N2)-methyltransferase